MKKVKLSLDKQALQDFFVHHGEKVVLALVVVCFFLYVYRAIGREMYPRSADKLAKAAEDADKTIDSTKPEAGLEVPPYSKEVESTAGQISVDFYQENHLWCPPIVDPPPKRGEPLLETVHELRGEAGYGAVRTTGRTAVPMDVGLGGKNIRGERWVVLTGLVPYADEVKDYVDAFKHAARQGTGVTGARRPMTGMQEGGMVSPDTGIDIPLYVHYHVERVEVTSPDQVVTEAQWEQGAIHVLNAKRDAMRDGWTYGQTATHVFTPIGKTTSAGVAPQYKIPALDFPLPPLETGWSMGDSIAHAPEIPLYVPPKYDRRMPPNQIPGPGPEPGPTEKPVPDHPTGDQPDLPVAGPGGMPGAIPGVPPGIGGENPEMMMPQGYGPEEMGMGPGMGAPGRTQVKMPPVRLFRFIDRTVEPGKHYRYRVRLMLANPNYGKPLRDLERIELAKDQYIMTDWSEPTSIINVPRDDRLLVLSVKPSVWTAHEPIAKVALIKWLNNEGIEADRIFPTGKDGRAYRGEVLNLAGCKWPETEKAPRPRKSKKKKKTMAPGMEGMEGSPSGEEGLFGPGMVPGGSEMATPAKEQVDVDYLTEAMVLDMRGGDRIDISGATKDSPPSSTDSALNAPGEVLVLDVNGDLVVHNELQDAAEYDKIQKRTNPPAPESPMMGSGEEGLFGEMPGEMMGTPPAGHPTKTPARKTPLRRKR